MKQSNVRRKVNYEIAHNVSSPIRNKLAPTEVEAYGFIREGLKDIGWNVKNPSLGSGGHVWTQNQCFAHPDLKKALGKNRPENIIKVSEKLVWIIEAKASRKQIDQAMTEAIGFYCKRINAGPGRLRAVLASGVAGDEDSGYIIRTKVRVNGSWRPVTINGQEATGLLSPGDVRILLERESSDIREFAPPQWIFLRSAERINEILHMGGINKNDRAKTMAALLLSVIDEPPNLDVTLPVLISEINGRSEAILKEKDKPDFAPFVRILPPTNTTNHVKFKTALIHTIQELQNLNIRSAMNSSTDVLGQFYEVFLKYGNGAKEIGIVLTPRHITRFAVESVGISSTDIVLDLACGTGGFLVAAFDYIRKTCSTAQRERFRQHNLFGVEQESYVAVLAIVNMIFRGDGRHHIAEGDCFKTYLVPCSEDGHSSARFSTVAPQIGKEPVTRVLMNPPFALRTSPDKEFRFVSHALSLMADGGLLFSLLPLGTLFGAHDEKDWRKNELLANHTLLAVISLPHDLFMPAALKQVAGIIIKKGIPHVKEQSVFWARVAHDGHITEKSKRLPAAELKRPRETRNDIPIVLPALRSFIANPTIVVNEPMLFKTAPIDFSDPLLELIPEAYLDSKTPSPSDLQLAVQDMTREAAAFLVRFGKEKLINGFDEAN